MHMRKILALLGVSILAFGLATVAAQADDTEPTTEPQAVTLLVEPVDDGTTDNDPDANTDSNARHVGSVPHATRNWSPRPDCINFNKVNGDIPAKFKVNDVITEYENKVPNLPNLAKLAENCQSGANAVAHIRVDYVPNPSRNYCARYSGAGDLTSVVQLTDNGSSCNGEEREWSCSGIGMSIGEHGYTTDNNGRGCHYRGDGANPDFLSSGFTGSEANVLNVAWN